MRVLVCGGRKIGLRSHTAQMIVASLLFIEENTEGDLVLIQGNASGADRAAKIAISVSRNPPTVIVSVILSCAQASLSDHRHDELLLSTFGLTRGCASLTGLTIERVGKMR